MHKMWQNNYHYFAEEYINAIDGCCLFFCFHLMNIRRWNLIKIRSHAFLGSLTHLIGFLGISRSNE